jgi:DNA-binding transcriptional regulator YhcF (GntR family)
VWHQFINICLLLFIGLVWYDQQYLFLSACNDSFMNMKSTAIDPVEEADAGKSQGFSQRMKYMQLAEYINNQIESGQLHINDRLPSLKQLTDQLGMSKETVLKGLNYLTEKGIVESVYRKGYYVRKITQYHPYRVFLLLDKMNILRDKLYNAFFETIHDQADVDVYFHHHNYKVFEKLIRENLNSYTHFVVATFLKESVTDLLNLIPAQKRILLDYDEQNLKDDYACIYQDFKADIQESLAELIPRLKKYQRLVLVAPKEAYHAQAIKEGFRQFCTQHGFLNKIVQEVSANDFTAGDVYITFGRYDLDDIKIIKLTREKGWQLGRQIGLISYNDTAVKEVLENGITVISTDFARMGKEAALAILDKKAERVRIPAQVITRNSL